MAQGKVRVGIIGAGHIVNQRYLTGYKEIPEAEVVAIADLAEGQAFGDKGKQPSMAGNSAGLASL